MGKMLRGFMVSTIADRLGIPFKQAVDMAAAAEAGLVKHEFHTVTLTAEGQERWAILTILPVERSAARRSSAKPSAARPKPRSRRR
jgi:hypothetical protein